jgi:hypothetical protein
MAKLTIPQEQTKKCNRDFPSNIVYIQLLLHQNKSSKFQTLAINYIEQKQVVLKIALKTALTSFEKLLNNYENQVILQRNTSRMIQTPPNHNNDPGFKRTFHKHLGSIIVTHQNFQIAEPKTKQNGNIAKNEQQRFKFTN